VQFRSIPLQHLNVVAALATEHKHNSREWIGQRGHL